MKKTHYFYVVLLLVLIGVFGSILLIRNIDKDTEKESLPGQPFTSSDNTSDFTASFEIYTNKTKRVFTAAMYHNQSPDIYIQSSDPSRIYVKKDGVRWKDFFDTLPFSLTEECLITGTNETFCNTENKKLHFFLNNNETPDALNYYIEPGDLLLISYD